MTGISLRGLSKVFGANAVIPPLDLEVASGEFLVLLGPSGCGKSTLLRLIAGLETVSVGEILIDGAPAQGLEPSARGCAMVFQTYALYPHMTVQDNIGYALKVAGVGRAARAERVRAVAAKLGLEELLARKPAQLSGGQRQRVAMGRAMIREPRIFLYDEPLSNLDARLRVAMRIEIRRLHQELHTTTLFVTHDQVEAMTLADRIAVMNKGTIEQVGTPAEIYANPATSYVAGFVGTPGMNLLPAQLEAGGVVLQLADGQRLHLPPDKWSGVAAGPVICGFRAEDATLGPEGLQAAWQFAEELGPARLVHLKLAGEAVVVVQAGVAPGAEGHGPALAIAGDRIRLFNAVTGRRIDPHP